METVTEWGRCQSHMDNDLLEHSRTSTIKTAQLWSGCSIQKWQRNTDVHKITVTENENPHTWHVAHMHTWRYVTLSLLKSVNFPVLRTTSPVLNAINIRFVQVVDFVCQYCYNLFYLIVIFNSCYDTSDT